MNSTWPWSPSLSISWCRVRARAGGGIGVEVGRAGAQVPRWRAGSQAGRERRPSNASASALRASARLRRVARSAPGGAAVGFSAPAATRAAGVREVAEALVAFAMSVPSRTPSCGLRTGAPTRCVLPSSSSGQRHRLAFLERCLEVDEHDMVAAGLELGLAVRERRCASQGASSSRRFR